MLGLSYIFLNKEYIATIYKWWNTSVYFNKITESTYIGWQTLLLIKDGKQLSLGTTWSFPVASESVSPEAQTPSWEPGSVSHGAANFLFFHILLFLVSFLTQKFILNGIYPITRDISKFQLEWSPPWMLSVVLSLHSAPAVFCVSFPCSISHGHACTPGLTLWLHFELLWHFSLVCHLSVDTYFVDDTNRLIF